MKLKANFQIDTGALHVCMFLLVYSHSKPSLRFFSFFNAKTFFGKVENCRKFSVQKFVPESLSTFQEKNVGEKMPKNFSGAYAASSCVQQAVRSGLQCLQYQRHMSKMLWMLVWAVAEYDWLDPPNPSDVPILIGDATFSRTIFESVFSRMLFDLLQL